MGYVDDGFQPLTLAELQAEHDEHEAGARYGDPRRCPRHPHVKTSSGNGLFDAPCGECEAECDRAADEDEAYQVWVAAGAPKLVAGEPRLAVVDVVDDEVWF